MRQPKLGLLCGCHTDNDVVVRCRPLVSSGVDRSPGQWGKLRKIMACHSPPSQQQPPVITGVEASVISSVPYYCLSITQSI